MQPDQDATEFCIPFASQKQFCNWHVIRWDCICQLYRCEYQNGTLTTFELKGTEGALDPAEKVSDISSHSISEYRLEIRESGTVVYDQI